eukprot:7543745-Pyramimonas_sp.AAC.1
MSFCFTAQRSLYWAIQVARKGRRGTCCRALRRSRTTSAIGTPRRKKAPTMNAGSRAMHPNSPPWGGSP